MRVAPVPAYPATSTPAAAPAVVQIWQAGQGPRWTAPACTGWSAGPGQGFRALVALAGRIQIVGGADPLLDRFGAISMLRGVRCWSTSDGGWRPLASSASAFDGPDPGWRRVDFTAAELRSGRDAYFVQHDSRSSNDVVYRMCVLESSAGMQQPLAIAIISGLMAQFPLVLLAMPVLIGLTVPKAKRQADPAPG